ncbi:MAG: hypothetical protein ACKVH8_16405 [Pirellulales bacterium]
MRQHLAVYLAIACLFTWVNKVNADDEIAPNFTITTKRTDDKIEIKIDKDETTFSIHSPLGISNATIKRNEDHWPKRVVLHLHLKGLENFQVTSGKVSLAASVSSTKQKPRIRLWKDKQEDSPLTSKSVYWMEIQMIGRDGKPVKQIPLKDGHIEMRLPQALFKDNPKTITVSWIDFYRG